MQLGISTASYFNRMSTEDAIDDLAAHQVPLCELFLNSFSEYSGEILDDICGRLDRTRLPVYSIHPMSTQFEPQLFSIHPRQRGDAWKILELVLAAGKRVGAHCYVMHGPVRVVGGGKNLQLDRLIPVFREIGQLCRAYGMRLTLENVNWCVFSSPDFGRRLAEKVDETLLGFTLDVKQAWRSGYDPLLYVDAVGSRIVNLHLCDAVHKPDGSLSLVLPGMGDCDLSRLSGALSEKGYTGPAFIEVYSDMYKDTAALYACYNTVKKLLDKPAAF